MLNTTFDPSRPGATDESFAELVSHAAHRETPAETLTAIVRLIKARFDVAVCSVYLVEPDRHGLVLAATEGLRPESVGQVKMPYSEGLAGLVAESLAPVVEDEASKHPRFKYFPETGEDVVKSFAGVPIVDRDVLQGVLVVQTKQTQGLEAGAVDYLVAAGRQLGPLVSKARTMEQFVGPVQEKLWALARNMKWCWSEEATEIFRELDPVRWRELGHAPIPLLEGIGLNELAERASRQVLHSRINHAHRITRNYLESDDTWGAMNSGVLRARPVAYFSAEFGLHESFPIYSGGLGILAGDHLKSASDLGIPLVAVGLFYGQGYFRQRLDEDGYQREDYFDTKVENLPLVEVIGNDGQPVQIAIETRTGVLRARVWSLAVGRCRLLMLDTNVPENEAEDRELTSRLYGGDERTRIRQELLPGVGGVRALTALGINPGVLHMNEGHSAFAALELVRNRMDYEGLDFDEAFRRVAAMSCFTTHTPVPAGHDYFPPEMVEEHLGPLREAVGLSHEQLVGLGRRVPEDGGEPFCMTTLALKSSRRANGVSALHGVVSRQMWASLWPSRSEEEIPIGHVTNGIHIPSWLAPQMKDLYSRYFEAGWLDRTANPNTWSKVGEIDDGELWETHLVLRNRLITFVRDRVATQCQRRNDPPAAIAKAETLFNRDALTIGFARRFATYKRATLLFRDVDRVAELLGDPMRPVQFVFAGKAHPRDEPGKEFIRSVVELSRDPRFEGRVAFVENYDFNVGRHLVQGVDVWLNNPRRPMEASGTSGQKVVLNGGLNMSILDGWWAEAYDGTNGFAIGDGTQHVDEKVTDGRDGDALLDTLENEVVPLFYDRDEDGLPTRWIARMKSAIRTLGWRFDSDRMVMDYVRNCYVPAAGGVSCEIRQPRGGR